MFSHKNHRVVLTGLLALTAALTGCATGLRYECDATTPMPRPYTVGSWWTLRHKQKLELAEKHQYDLVFLGDSITYLWEVKKVGREVWDKYYAPRHALDLGYNGDKTENVLWRIDHGELDHQSPKLLVLMIGTNNTGHRHDSPEDIAAGIHDILARLEDKVPDTKILLLAIFPRNATKDDPMRVNNDRANEILSQFADNKRIYFLNINDKFLTTDGVLTKDVFYDLLHPAAKGYRIWAEAIEPMVDQLMGEPKTNITGNP